jgi:muramoyltetrapeptide carboxypeptidase
VLGLCVCANMRLPPPLAAGSRVALVAPSGPLLDATDLDRAIENTHSFGWEAVVGDHVRERDGYLAGNDESRRADLNRFAADESIDAIWCIRGGYGAMRLLNSLDYTAWRDRPRALIGYSDITALHAAIGPRAGLVTFHGPTARSELTDFTRASLRAAVTGDGAGALTANDVVVLHGGSAGGPLAGGNLAVLSALAGTPFAPQLDGTILVLEDVNESVYRLDRMLTQLRLSGALDRVAGIAFGQFTEIPLESNDGRALDDLLGEVAARSGVPCIARIPVGHVADQWTLPLGRTATLDADKKTITIE